MTLLIVLATTVWFLFGLNAAGKELDHHYRFGTSEFNPHGQDKERSEQAKHITYVAWTLGGLISWLIITASDGSPRPRLNWRWVNE